MFQGYKFRIYPTTEQQITLAKSFGCCRWYWNYTLNLCQETYKQMRKGLSRKAIQGLLPQLKKEYPWLKDAYSQCLQVVALNLSTAYKNFFEKRARLPQFKSKHGRQSISYPQSVKFEGDYLKLPGKVGLIYCRRHREFKGLIKTVTISKNRDGKYHASVLVDDGKEIPNSSTNGKAIGIDLGLTHFAITSDGDKYSNPKHFAKHQRNLKRKQQKLSRIDIRSWTCEHCQTTHDRDINAAINIKTEALRILSLGTSDTASLRGCQSPEQTSVSSDAIPVDARSPHLLVEKCG